MLAIILEKGLTMIIHPICLIDEYASKGRIWVWFRPPRDPTKTFLVAITVIRRSVWFIDEYINRRINGVNFCQVDRVKHKIHGREFITEGNQKWQGTIPAFIIRAIVIILQRIELWVFPK